MQDLAGKVAVITGAASGIGRGMAESFVSVGMRVVLADVEEDALRKTTETLRGEGADVHSVVTDVSKAEQVQALGDESLEKFGAVHVVCNNAGIVIEGASIWETTLDDWKWILGVNLMGVVHGVRTFTPIMLEQGAESHIINTASMAGLTAGYGAYGVTKCGVVSLSESLYFDLEQAHAKTKVSVLCPGFAATNIMDAKRNRPVELEDAPPSRTDSTAEASPFAEYIRKGFRPRVVGDLVLSAIREERFYVLTDPDWNRMIEYRMQSVLEGRNPKVMFPDTVLPIG